MMELDSSRWMALSKSSMALSILESKEKNLLAHIPVTAGSIMPVDCILLVERDGSSEVFDSFFKVVEPVPDKSSPIERRCVGFITFKDSRKELKKDLLVEVLKS